MTGTMRDLDVLAYQLRLSNVVADDGGAFDRLATILGRASLGDSADAMETAIRVLGLLPQMCKAKRSKDGLSVRAVAALTGLSACSISRFERGHDVVLSSAVKLIAWLGGTEPLDFGSEVAS